MSILNMYLAMRYIVNTMSEYQIIVWDMNLLSIYLRNNF